MTSLDRQDWSFQRCEGMHCENRAAQLIVDERPRARAGKYLRLCWQCYWGDEYWRYGPIVNCGPVWDVLDVRRGK